VNGPSTGGSLRHRLPLKFSSRSLQGHVVGVLFLSARPCKDECLKSCLPQRLSSRSLQEHVVGVL